MNTSQQFESSKLSKEQLGELSHATAESKARSTNTRPLTDRQRQIAACVAADMTSKQIANHLGISSAKTVDSHLLAIREKIGAHSRVGVALWYVSEQQLATPARAIAAAIVSARDALVRGNAQEAARFLNLALAGLDVPEAEIDQVLQRVERRAVNGIPVRTVFERYEGSLQ